VSYLPGWQEGAVLSAEHVVRGIMGRPIALKATQAELPAPDSGATTGAY
jgi:hypothetical protein